MLKRTISSTSEVNSNFNNGQGVTHSTGEYLHNESNTLQLNLKSGYDAFKNAKFSEALDMCNIAMESIVKEQLKVLDLRITTLIKLANLKRAEEYAILMTRLAPSQSIGYIRLGDLWMLRGNQKQAIQVYEKGLKLMKKKEDHGLLAQRRDQAVQKSEERFDIIANLPIEIANLLLAELSQDQCFMLLDVSRTWRDKISAYAPAWATIEFQDTDDYTEKNIRLLPCVCSHIIKLSGPDNDLYREMLYNQLAKGGYNKLKKLYLYNRVASNTPVIVPALLSIGKTLECMEINIENILIPDLKKIFETCTELRSLVIEGETPSALEIIQQSCKRLERFGIGGSQFYNCFKDGDNEMKGKKVFVQQFATNELSTLNGIQDFSLNAFKTPIRYIPIIQRNQATIRNLYLDLWSLRDEEHEDELEYREDWESLGDSCKFPNLLSLSFHSDTLLFTPVIARTIRNSPHIRSLTMDGIFLGDLDQEFITAIADLPCLQKLELLGVDGWSRDVEAVFRALSIRGKTDASTLETVIFSYTEIDLEGVIDSLVDIRTLRHLEFSSLTCDSEEKYMIQLFSGLQSHPNIRSISLIEINCINDEMLVRLAAIQGLEHLRFEGQAEITTDGLSVFDGSKVKLEVERCYNIDGRY